MEPNLSKRNIHKTGARMGDGTRSKKCGLDGRTRICDKDEIMEEYGAELY